MGLNIVNDSNKPDKVLVDRIQHATRTFNALKSNCRLLGITNVRVRIQLVNALVCSVLQYGSVIYACLSNTETALSPANMVFLKAEILIRKMLPWAFQFDIDTRCSLMYLIAN